MYPVIGDAFWTDHAFWIAPSAASGLICDALAKMTTPEEQTEGLLNEWMVLARHNKRVNEEASSYFRKWQT